MSRAEDIINAMRGGDVMEQLLEVRSAARALLDSLPRCELCKAVATIAVPTGQHGGTEYPTCDEHGRGSPEWFALPYAAAVRRLMEVVG